MDSTIEAVEIINRRGAYLRSRGEHTRNTVAWRDYLAERRELAFWLANHGLRLA